MTVVTTNPGIQTGPEFYDNGLESEITIGQGDCDPRFDHEVFRDHSLIESRGVTVGLEQVVEGEDADHMWEMYNRGFSALNASALSHQSLSREEFLEELADPGVIKYMARNSDGVPVGYMAVEKGLFLPDPSPYWPQQDDDLLSQVQNEIDPNAPSFYISSFLVDKEAEEYMLRTSQILLRAAFRHFNEVNASLGVNSVCFYDFAPENFYLPDYIVSSGRPDSEFEGASMESWPVYVAEWYRLGIDRLNTEGLDKILTYLPEDAFSDHDGQLTIEDGVPLEIQVEKLEGDADDYITITNLPSAPRDPDSVSDRLSRILSETGKKYALLHLKRHGSVQDPVDGLGDRLDYQSFAALKLLDSPHT